MDSSTIENNGATEQAIGRERGQLRCFVCQLACARATSTPPLCASTWIDNAIFSGGTIMNILFRYCLLLFISSLLLVACGGREPDPQKIGVFADTNKGLTELTSYGEQISMNSYNLAKATNPPKVSKVNALYVNMPDIKISNSKFYWVASLEKPFTEDESAALKIDTESTKSSNMYRLSCPELEGKTGGYLVLKVGMPLGTADRMYPIFIEK